MKLNNYLLGLSAFIVFGINSANSQILISEYVEGSSFNKALELWNVSGTNITFGAGAGQLDVDVSIYSNGSATPNTTIPLTSGFTLLPGHVFVLTHSSASFATNADQATGSANWNGDDAVVVSIGGVNVLDSIGQVGFDPGSEWGIGLTSTADNTLRRAFTNLTADLDPSDAYDPSVAFEGFATDSFDELGVPPNGPFLNIESAGAGVVLNWSGLAGGYQLQSTTNSPGAGAVWSNVTEIPVILNKLHVVTNDLLSPQKFYRLLK